MPLSQQLVDGCHCVRSPRHLPVVALAVPRRP
jgi:hypothetical protein